MIEQIPYDVEELKSVGPQRVFSGRTLRQIAMPVGGIGTGSISLGGRGQLQDWEIFNRPNKGFRPQSTFATLWVRQTGRAPLTKVLESPVQPPYSGWMGADRDNGEGFPHFRSNTFRGEYPFGWIDFTDEEIPVRVSMEAFNPFIPLNPFDSSLPVAILTYRLVNASDLPVDATLAFTLQNVVGYSGSGPLEVSELGQSQNLFRSEDGLSGMILTSAKCPRDSHRYGNIAVATDCGSVTYTGKLGLESWFDMGRRFWNTFSQSGTLDDTELADPTADGKTAVCALGMRIGLEPGESRDVKLIIAWHFPNFVKYWHAPEGGEKPQWKNYYATQFEDAWAVASYVNENFERLRGETLKFHDALFGSTLPADVLEAVSSQASTLKTPTCLRLEDGTFYGFEGCCPQRGCCEGSCTHVWNYAQTLAFLFPSLERSMRSADYTYNLREEDGRMCFRIGLPLGTSSWEVHAAADGQLGGVMKTYRDWLLCGDDEWLKALWPRVKKALSYAWKQWDQDRDGLPEGEQHNTYDIEFHGPNPFVGAFYLGALRAAERMAAYLGEPEDARLYREFFEKGSRKMDEELFNGEYYVQKYDPQEAPRYQFGEGCLSDQMLGQWLANICGLGYLLSPENVRSTLASVFRHNWRTSLWDHPNPQRIYATGDEAGLLVCSWPRGGRPAIPTIYFDEVWTGAEYHVASHLIMEGFLEEGLAIVKAVRERHDGERRNPWNEAECGNHYARAMSSWGLILALSGYYYNAPERLMAFAPRFRRHCFSTFWSNGNAWGTFSQKFEGRTADICLSVLAGEMPLAELRIGRDRSGECVQLCAELGGEPVAASCQADGEWLKILLPADCTIGMDQRLVLKLTLDGKG